MSIGRRVVGIRCATAGALASLILGASPAPAQGLWPDAPWHAFVTGRLPQGFIPNSLAAGDLDGDGDLDLVELTLDGSPRVYVNRTDAPQRQMLITLQDPLGTPIGATLKLRLDDGPRVTQVLSSRGFQAASDARLHVAGSGAVRTADVRWNGGPNEILDASALGFGRQIVVRRGQGVVSSRPLAAAAEP